MGDEYVLPLGYPTEQFLFKLKNDVHEVLSAHKEKNKNNEDDVDDFIDPGDVKGPARTGPASPQAKSTNATGIVYNVLS